MELIEQVFNKPPLLGICLGHQALGIHFGATLGHAPTVCHGKPDIITHTGKYIFEGIPSPTQIGRYHSLHVHSLPEYLEIVATSSDDCIQAFAHKTLPCFWDTVSSREYFISSDQTDLGTLLILGCPMLILLFSCSSPPCSSPLDEGAGMIDFFIRLEEDRCLHDADVETLNTQMQDYHTQTTLHCDQVYRRSSRTD